MSQRIVNSLLIALILGTLFPYFWIVLTGKGEIVDESSVDHVYASSLPQDEANEYYKSRMRPMTVNEKLRIGLDVATEIWQLYLFFSCLIGAIVFVINLFIWP